MSIRSRLFAAVATILFAAATAGARAEVSEVTIAQQYGVSFLPLMWMEHNKLIEKHAKAQGLASSRPTGPKLAGPAAITDGLLSGAVTFSAVGAPSLITLWGKTKGNIGVMGVSAVTTYPLYLNVRNPEREIDQGFHRQGQDRGARGQGVDAGDHAADGGRESVRRRQSVQARPVHRHAVASRTAWRR